MLYAFLKLHCIWMLKTLDHQINEFKSIYLFSYFELSALTFTVFNVKLDNKLLEQRILINNCLAPFDSEFKYIHFGGYPFSLFL